MSPFPASHHRQVLSHPRRTGPHHWHGDFGRKNPSLRIFLLFLLPSAKNDFLWSGISLGSAGISWDSGCASLNFLGTPSFPSSGVRSRKGPNSVSPAQKKLNIPGLSSAQIPTTAPDKWRKLTFSHPHPTHGGMETLIYYI